MIASGVGTLCLMMVVVVMLASGGRLGLSFRADLNNAVGTVRNMEVRIKSMQRTQRAVMTMVNSMNISDSVMFNTENRDYDTDLPEDDPVEGAVGGDPLAASTPAPRRSAASVRPVIDVAPIRAAMKSGINYLIFPISRSMSKAKKSDVVAPEDQHDEAEEADADAADDRTREQK